MVDMKIKIEVKRLPRRDRINRRTFRLYKSSLPEWRAAEFLNYNIIIRCCCVYIAIAVVLVDVIVLGSTREHY